MKGLFPQAVPSQKQRFAVLIPQGKGKHPVKSVQALDSLLLIEVNNDLRICGGIKCMALFLKLTT